VKAGTSRPNTFVIGLGETPLLPVSQNDVLAGADKSVDDTSKKVVGISGPNTSVIALDQTPLGEKALVKPPVISNQQGKILAKNKNSTAHTAGKKSLKKPSAISKLQEEKFAKNKSSTPSTAGKQALKKPSSSISKEIVINETSKWPTRKRSKRNTKENHWFMTNTKQSESDTEKNPSAMDSPNYKIRKSLLSDGDLKKVDPFTRKLHTFYMQRGKSDVDSQILVALGPETNAWPQRDESSNEL
jgi:hypothetical protein